MFLSEAAASGPTFFYLVPLVVFHPADWFADQCHLWQVDG